MRRVRPSASSRAAATEVCDLPFPAAVLTRGVCVCVCVCGRVLIPGRVRCRARRERAEKLCYQHDLLQQLRADEEADQLPRCRLARGTGPLLTGSLTVFWIATIMRECERANKQAVTGDLPGCCPPTRCTSGRETICMLARPGKAFHGRSGGYSQLSGTGRGDPAPGSLVSLDLPTDGRDRWTDLDGQMDGWMDGLTNE